LQKQLRISTVYVTHSDAEARALAHHVVMMRAGRIEYVEKIERANS